MDISLLLRVKVAFKGGNIATAFLSYIAWSVLCRQSHNFCTENEPTEKPNRRLIFDIEAEIPNEPRVADDEPSRVIESLYNQVSVVRAPFHHAADRICSVEATFFPVPALDEYNATI
jgi:hypothetical protein